MVKIKICGLKTLADVEAVNRYLPDYVGFVFANTKRFVADEQASAMKQALDQRIKAVGVFVDEPLAHVKSLCSRGIIDAVQLHGAEPETYIRELKEQTGRTVIKAVRVQSAAQVMEMMSEAADFMLFDTYKKGVPGGTGERLSLDILQESLRDMAAKGAETKPYFLAGGLDSENVAGVLAEMARVHGNYAGNYVGNYSGCYAVDVSTGVETGGVKDESKMRRFIEKVRQCVKTHGD